MSLKLRHFQACLHKMAENVAINYTYVTTTTSFLRQMYFALVQEAPIVLIGTVIMKHAVEIMTPTDRG